jgi:IclR family transcriptional regulator, acetate operon repressor
MLTFRYAESQYDMRRDSANPEATLRLVRVISGIGGASDYDEEMAAPDAVEREETDSRSTLGTVRNATIVLELLSVGPAYQPISELSQRSGLSLATLHRLLRSLALAGLVEQHPESARYGLGPQVLHLAARYLNRLPTLLVLSPYLVELRNATGATIQISVLVDGEVVRVDRLDGVDTGIFREAHHVEDARGTAAGRILLGRSEVTVGNRAVAGGTDDQTDDEERLRWASVPYLALPVGDQVEVAVPVLDRRDRPVAALSARIPASASSQEVEERIAAQLLRVTNSARLAIGDG